MNVTVVVLPVLVHVAEPGVWYVTSKVTVPVKGPLNDTFPEKLPFVHVAEMDLMSTWSL